MRRDAEETELTLLEIRKWQIERIFDIASKRADMQQKMAVKLFLAGAGFVATVPAYAILLDFDVSSVLSVCLWAPSILCLASATFAYIDAFDSQADATLALQVHISLLGQDDRAVEMRSNLPVSLWTARVYIRISAYSLSTSVAAAVGFALAQSTSLIGS